MDCLPLRPAVDVGQQSTFITLHIPNLNDTLLRTHVLYFDRSLCYINGNKTTSANLPLLRQACMRL